MTSPLRIHRSACCWPSPLMAGSWEWETPPDPARHAGPGQAAGGRPEHLQDDLYGQLLPGLLYETVRDPVAAPPAPVGEGAVNRKGARVPATHDGFSHWARIEPRPRGHDFDRTLQARVEDPLWMLTRQGSSANSTARMPGRR